MTTPEAAHTPGAPDRAAAAGAGPDASPAQAALMAFKGWILDHPTSGYVESINHPDTMSTTVLWHGDPAGQPAILDEARRRGITIDIIPRRYGRPQLDTAARTAFAHAWTGFRVTAVSALRADFDGITVRGVYTAGPQARTATADLAAGIAGTTGVAARVEVGAAPTLTSTRDTDSAPFNAAGFMVDHLSNGIYTWCSSGFAVKDPAGHTHTTTARHCDAPNYRAADGSALYGQSVTLSGNGAARELSGTGFYWAFDGAYNTSTKRTVVGLRDVSLGDYVCTSGGNSGSHCNIQVNDMSLWLDDGFGAFQSIEAVNWAYHGVAAAEGDSGGAVLVHSGANVYAVGMMQAGDNPGHAQWTCPSGTVHTSASCFSYVEFTSMRVIVNSMPGTATLVTGPSS